MEKIKLLHLADLHIGMENYGRLDSNTGINSRVLDFVRRFDEAITYAIDEDVDAVIFAGDAYKSRDPNSTFRREFARRVKRLANAEITVLLLVGNHDLPSVHKRATALDTFDILDVPNVIVANKEKLYTIDTKRGKFQIGAVPYPAKSRLMTRDEYKNMSIEELDRQLSEIVSQNIEGLASEVSSDYPAVLTAHLSVSGARLGSEQSIMLGRDVLVMKSVLVDSAWDYVALGHIHRFQDLNEGDYPAIVYSGSLERVDFGEEREDKGFVSVELARNDTTYQFHQVHARPFVTVRVEVKTSDPMTEILRRIAREDMMDAVVRVLIKATPERAALISERDVRRAVKEQGAFFVAAIGVDVERRHRQIFGEQSPEELSPMEMLEKYLVAKDTPPERVATLVQYGEEILREISEDNISG